MKSKPIKLDVGRASDLPPGEREVVLLRQIADRDWRAFELFYRSYYRRLIRFLDRLLPRPDLAEEVLNDTMLVVFRKADRFTNTSRVSTWIFGIAYRKALKALKKAGFPFEALSAEDAASAEANPEFVAIERESSLVIRSMIATLSVEHRAVVELTYYHGCSYKEIADIVGCPVDTVKTRMFHARRKLKALLAAQGNVPS